MPRKLATVPGIRLGHPVSQSSKILQVIIPATIERDAPPLLALFQYKPIVSGTNNDTKLSIDDSLTSS